MPLPYPFPPTRTNYPTIEGTELKLAILERRKQNIPFSKIAEEFDRTQGYIYKMYKNALRDVLRAPVKEVVALEMLKLNKIEQRLEGVLNQKHYMYNQGQVIHDTVEDANGNLVLDEEGAPITYKVEDTAPILSTIDRQLRVMERRAKLLGLDKPTKTAMTDPEGNKSQAVHFYLPSNGRDDAETNDG